MYFYYHTCQEKFHKKYMVYEFVIKQFLTLNVQSWTKEKNLTQISYLPSKIQFDVILKKISKLQNGVSY